MSRRCYSTRQDRRIEVPNPVLGTSGDIFSSVDIIIHPESTLISFSDTSLTLRNYVWDEWGKKKTTKLAYMVGSFFSY